MIIPSAAKADTIEVTAIDSQNSVATEKEQIEAVLEKGVKAFGIGIRKSDEDRC